MRRAQNILAAILVALVFCVVGTVPAVAADKVDINKANAEELKVLSGIGDVIAKRIVEYRTKNGPFQKPEDIMNVKGIGEKKFKAIKDMIVVGKAKAEKKAAGKKTDAKKK